MHNQNPAPPPLTCQLMEGRSLRRALLQEAAVVSQNLLKKGVSPSLHVVLVGEDKPSKIYVNAKLAAAQKVGIEDVLHHLPTTATQAEVNTLLQTLSAAQGVHGILLQLPLPKHLNKQEALSHITPEKDVDGLTTANIGRLFAGEEGHLQPCTPLGIMRLLAAYGTPLQGQHVVVLGRSQLVGKPLVELFSQQNATVTLCHRYTQNLAQFTGQADVLVVATGTPALITGDMLKPGCTVVDVGVNRLPNGEVVGDCDAQTCRSVASHLSPVPGGVGPMTVATLMTNTLDACCRQHNLPTPTWGTTPAF